MQIAVTVSPHWGNAMVLRPLARPFIRIDGTEYAAVWDQTDRRACRCGRTRRGEPFIRYKGTRAPLGTGRLTVPVQPGEDVAVAARNGRANHMPFRPTRIPADS